MINENIWKGNWKQLKGKIQKTWGELTDDELDKFEGKRKEVAGYIQKKFGEKENDINNKFDEFESEYRN